MEIDNQMPWIYVGDKSDEGQDASLRVEMGNVGLLLAGMGNDAFFRYSRIFCLLRYDIGGFI